MGWNYLSIPKLQRLHGWNLRMDKWFHPTLYTGCNYLFMLGLKLNHVGNRGPSWRNQYVWLSSIYWPRDKKAHWLGDASTVYPKKYAHGFCFAVLCCGYTLTDFLISIRLISLALWQSNDCPSASKTTLMNMDKYFMWIHYERLHKHNKAKHNKTVCIFLGIYCMLIGTEKCFLRYEVLLNELICY